VGHHEVIFFLWRPLRRDPDDDLVLELTVKARCDRIVTFNIRDFVAADRFGIRVSNPGEFLQEMG
jgi:predicted nucleic acid-binding protein